MFRPSKPIKVKAPVTVGFHVNYKANGRNLFHQGIDWGIPEKTPLYAIEDGIWEKVEKSKTDYGYYIFLKHADGYQSRYCHLTKFTYQKGWVKVRKGDLIGYSGGKKGTPGAGLSTGPHLHFEIRKNGVPINPLSLIK